MATATNPEIRVRVEDIFDNVWDSADEDTRVDIEIEVTKDLEGEPNQAIVRVFNLNDDTVNILSSGVSFIELWFNLYGEEALTSCFLGEIVNAYTTEEHPGSVTNLICESQRSHSRDKYIDLNYESGTAYSLIIDAMTDEIGLAVNSVQIPDSSIPSAVTFTGPAFLNLKRFVKNLGMFCYIVDGVLCISSVFEPPSATIVEIKKTIMTQQAQPTTRRDVRDLWYTSAMNNQEAAAAAQANSFEVNRGKVKKLSSQKVLDKNRELIEVDAVDTDIMGRSVEMLGLANLQPDTIIQIEGDESLYRVQRLSHRGDNQEGVITSIQADVFEGN